MRQVPRFTIFLLEMQSTGRKSNLYSSPYPLICLHHWGNLVPCLKITKARGITLGIRPILGIYSLTLIFSGQQPFNFNKFRCLMQVKHFRYMPDSGDVYEIRLFYGGYAWSPPQDVTFLYKLSASMIFCQLEGLILWLVCSSYQSGSFL